MNDELILLVPEAPPTTPETVEKQQRKLDLSALRIGLLDDSKANADHLLRLMTERIATEFCVKSVTTLRKGSVAIPATAQVLDELCRRGDFC